MHVYERILNVQSLITDILGQEERKGQPASRGKHTRATNIHKDVQKKEKLRFQVLTFSGLVFLVKGGELCHCASMAVKLYTIYTVSIPFYKKYAYTSIHAYTRIYIHIHTYSCVYIRIRTDTYIYAQIYT